jgi:hypothetical protein
VGLERGPLSLVSTIEELLGRNSSGSSLENREYGRGDPLCWPRDTHYPQKLTLTSPTSGGHSVGIIRLRTKATEFVSCTVTLLDGHFGDWWQRGGCVFYKFRSDLCFYICLCRSFVLLASAVTPWFLYTFFF